MSRKFKIHYILARIKDILHEDQYTFFIISHRIRLRMSNISDKSCKKIKTHVVFNKLFPENSAVCEKMWKILLQTHRPQITILRMRIARWIPKAIDTHLEYVVFTALSLQQWKNYRSSLLRLHVHCQCCHISLSGIIFIKRIHIYHFFSLFIPAV